MNDKVYDLSVKEFEKIYWKYQNFILLDFSNSTPIEEEENEELIDSFLTETEDDYILIISKSDNILNIYCKATKTNLALLYYPNGFTGYLLKKLIEKETEPLYTTNTILTNDSTGTITYGTSTTAIPPYSNFVTDSSATITLGPMKIENNEVTINGEKVLTREKTSTEKEIKKDMSEMFNFDFGPVTESNIKMSPFGIAIRSDNDKSYSYYNTKTKSVIECTPFAFDCKKFLYKMPVAVSAIAAGDVIMHRGVPMFVKSPVEDEEGRIVAIDIAASEEKYILPVKNMFGFNYVTKIVSLLDMSKTEASSENPFGNMLPFLMMQDGKDLDPMMLLLMNGNLGGGNLNPMMLYAMMSKEGKMKDFLPFLMMQSGQQMLV